jgi:CDP-diacylglycerol pyrophosphatase
MRLAQAPENYHHLIALSQHAARMQCLVEAKVVVNELPSESQEKLFRALGQAVVKNWGQLPHDIQQHLFEDAVASQDEFMRQQLAMFLHEKHPRTTDSMKARAIPEPDSLGG